MYAIIETGGKQHKVELGQLLYIERLHNEAEDEITFSKVLAIGGEEGAAAQGTPYVEGASVTAVLVKNGKQSKITVFTYKPKKGSKRKQGHRQPYSLVRITAINR
ncbi:MAG: 50S ribosomal protein L21 [Oscillospiraceae bacterium]|jgi:large subunit ribosomal protein L21|nr:50S ribosomal protein L21 [Oscillospiraceae bacterium]